MLLHLLYKIKDKIKFIDKILVATAVILQLISLNLSYSKIMKRNYTNPYTLDRKPIKLRDVYSMVPKKMCKGSASKY